MVQLEVEGVYLDLYDLNPPKLNFTIEDIEDTSTRSIFSRTFRVPATSNNISFFSTAFDINGVDFDIRQKRNANIYVNGILFRTGQLRLNKIYDTRDGAKIDYECIFLGETKDFGTSVGEGYLNELDLSEYDHVGNLENVEKSWLAFPEGTITDGLFEGDIIYPLIDFGVNYDNDGVPIETRISQNNTGDHFTQQSHPLPVRRFKPMIRVRALWDKIFEEAGYTYTSEFFKSRTMTQLYLSAFGNDENINTVGTSNNMLVKLGFDSYPVDIVPFDDVVYDYGNNWNTSTYRYVVDSSGTIEFSYLLDIVATAGEFSTGNIVCNIVKNGTTIIDSSTTGNFTGTQNFTLGSNFTETLTAGDYIDVRIVETNIEQYLIYSNSFFEVVNAPGVVSISAMLDDNYSKLDFIKDIITRFRLVMVPDKNIVGNFIIEPWEDYIGSGDLFDWTDKLDLTKDVVIEPLFFTQSARIVFEDSEGEDFLNVINQEVFKEVFGKLIVNGDNEFLEGERRITTNIIPTPITQIERKNTAIGTTFVIPQIHVHEAGEDPNYNPKHLPIKGNSRLLFYNGLKDTDGIDWFIQGSTTNPYTEYPMVSFYLNFPNTNNDINLNWQKETGYVEHDVNNGLIGKSVYDEYWSTYIDNLYNGFSRKITAHFILDETDLFDFTFNDVIRVKNTYYYVYKITDVAIGKRTSVKVELIKLNNYDVDITPVRPERVWNTTYVDWEDAAFEWDL